MENTKAMLIIDMPNNCEECKITYFQEHGESSICYSGDWSKRPSWCPLKPIPQRKEELHYPCNEYVQTFNEGYNRCIDDILGDTEDE